jgi:hypothetical protein
MAYMKLLRNIRRGKFNNYLLRNGYTRSSQIGIGKKRINLFGKSGRRESEIDKTGTSNFNSRTDLHHLFIEGLDQCLRYIARRFF